MEGDIYKESSEKLREGGNKIGNIK